MVLILISTLYYNTSLTVTHQHAFLLVNNQSYTLLLFINKTTTLFYTTFKLIVKYHNNL